MKQNNQFLYFQFPPNHHSHSAARTGPIADATELVIKRVELPSDLG